MALLLHPSIHTAPTLSLVEASSLIFSFEQLERSSENHNMPEGIFILRNRFIAMPVRGEEFLFVGPLFSALLFFVGWTEDLDKSWFMAAAIILGFWIQKAWKLWNQGAFVK